MVYIIIWALKYASLSKSQGPLTKKFQELIVSFGKALMHLSSYIFLFDSTLNTSKIKHGYRAGKCVQGIKAFKFESVGNI